MTMYAEYMCFSWQNKEIFCNVQMLILSGILIYFPFQKNKKIMITAREIVDQKFFEFDCPEESIEKQGIIIYKLKNGEYMVRGTGNVLYTFTFKQLKDNLATASKNLVKLPFTIHWSSILLDNDDSITRKRFNEFLKAFKEAFGEE